MPDACRQELATPTPRQPNAKETAARGALLNPIRTLLRLQRALHIGHIPSLIQNRKDPHQRWRFSDQDFDSIGQPSVLKTSFGTQNIAMHFTIHPQLPPQQLHPAL